MPKLLTALACAALAACAHRTEPQGAGPQGAGPQTAGDCTATTPLVAGAPGSPGHRIPSELHPEGASELAALMRAMEADLKAARASLARGESAPPLYEKHRRIRCAWPTSPADREGAFDALAQGYLERVRAFDAAPAREDSYRAVLGGCRACHEQSCPGPLAAIDALAP